MTAPTPENTAAGTQASPDMSIGYEVKRMDDDARAAAPDRLVSVGFSQNGLVITGEVSRQDAIALADALYEAAGDGRLRPPIDIPGKKLIPGVLAEKERRLAKKGRPK